jgi:hypothetical protein
MPRFVAIVVLAILAGLVAAQDGPKPDQKKSEAKKDAPKVDEKPPDGEEIDVHKTAERIADNAQKAGDRLKDKDPGENTRKIQEEIIKDIDALIRKAQNPPPSPMSSDMSPMQPPPKSDGMPPPKGSAKDGQGGGNPQKSPMGMSGGSSGSRDKADRRSRRERRPRGDSPMDTGGPIAKDPMGGMDPMPATPESKERGSRPSGDGGDRFGKTTPKRQNDKLADLYRDVWGHLPDRLRQEMDLYYREKFMPRYSELLRQYYAALAEQRKKGSEDR